MRRTQTMAAAGVTLAGLGALVGLAIGSGSGQKLVAQRTPPVEVRTQIIRRTINVYRREHPHHVSGTGPGGVPSGTALGGSSSVTNAVARTRSSGAGAATPAAPVVTTRSSGSQPRSGSTAPTGSGSHTLKTRSSGASSPGSGSSRTVSTRSSGGGDGEGNGGGHGD